MLVLGVFLGERSRFKGSKELLDGSSVHSQVGRRLREDSEGREETM